MTPTLPDGDPAPLDGVLPPGVGQGSRERAFGVYVHVPYCSVRCGYCDFNTYTATELGGGASQSGYAQTAIREIEFAANVMSRAGIAHRSAATVFFGGGTPTILPAADLVALVDSIRTTWGLAAGAEITTEANPDSVDAKYFDELAQGGFTRVSLGMQSVMPHVLATLERTHDPARLPEVVAAARYAGLEVSLDLIYGTPGESLDDFNRSLNAAIDLEPDHISAYALVLEDGTRMARQVRIGELAAPDDDDAASKYELADSVLAAAGYRWYEVSNWGKASGASGLVASCRHNLGYWRGDDWWGIGPGAHSYLGGEPGMRWWNVKHPRAYSDRIMSGGSPALAFELIDADTAAMENVMLRTRLSEGLAISELESAGREVIPGLIAEELIDARAAVADQRLILSLRGRLLADAVIRRLT